MILLVLTALVAALLDLTVFGEIRVAGVHGSLTAALVAVWTVTRGRQESMFLAPVAGLLLGLLGPGPLGASVLALAPAVLLGALRRPDHEPRRFPLSVMAAGGGGMAYVIIMGLIQTVATRSLPALQPLAVAALGGAAITAVLGTLVYLPVARLAPSRGAGAAQRY
ncbi:MAG: hypothetical protein U0531_10650 [Dehalococcoidia bacterium]